MLRASPALARALDRPFRGRWIFDVELLARLGHGGDGVAAIGGDAMVEVPLRYWRDVGGSRLRLGAMLWSGLQLLQLFVRLRAVTGLMEEHAARHLGVHQRALDGPREDQEELLPIASGAAPGTWPSGPAARCT